MSEPRFKMDVLDFEGKPGMIQTRGGIPRGQTKTIRFEVYDSESVEEGHNSDDFGSADGGLGHGAVDLSREEAKQLAINLLTMLRDMPDD